MTPRRAPEPHNQRRRAFRTPATASTAQQGPANDSGRLLQGAASQALHQIADGLGAELAAVWLHAGAGRFECWALVPPQSKPARLPSRPLRSLRTVRRAFRERELSLADVSTAPDLATLCQLVGFPTKGHFILVAVDGATASGVLLAARQAADWSAADRATLETVARHVANRLDPRPARARQAGPQTRQASPTPLSVGPLMAIGRRVMLALAASGRLPSTAPRLANHSARGERPAQSAPDRLLEQQTPATAADSSPATAENQTLPKSPVTAPDAQPVDVAPTVRSLSILSGAESTPERAWRFTKRRPPTGDQSSSALAATRLECYALAIDQLPWGILIIDHDHCIVAANRLAAELLHCECIPPGIEATRLFPEPVRASYALHSLAANPDPSRTNQHMLFEASRLRAELQPLCHPLVGYRGAVILLYRQTTLPASNAARMLPQLAAAMKTPLASLIRYRDVLRRGRASEERAARVLGRIEANLSRLQTLLDDLIVAAQLCRDEPLLGSTALAMADLVRDSARRAAPQFAEKDVELVLTLHEPIPLASAQPDAATVLVDNLLMNAARRSPPGASVQIEVATHTVSGDQGVVIAIADSGPALAPGAFGLLEVDCDGQDVTLAFVRLLAERMGARAWAESHPHGTRFCLRLPARRNVS